MIELDKNLKEINFAECVCFSCKNYQKDNLCKAFPDGIPVEILRGDNPHTKKHPEQKNEIIFKDVNGNET